MKSKKHPAGYYSQNENSNTGLIQLNLISTNPEKENLPPFTYWWEKKEINNVDENHVIYS